MARPARVGVSGNSTMRPVPVSETVPASIRSLQSIVVVHQPYAAGLALVLPKLFRGSGKGPSVSECDRSGGPPQRRRRLSPARQRRTHLRTVCSLTHDVRALSPAATRWAISSRLDGVVRAFLWMFIRDSARLLKSATISFP